VPVLYFHVSGDLIAFFSHRCTGEAPQFLIDIMAPPTGAAGRDGQSNSPKQSSKPSPHPQGKCNRNLIPLLLPM
jgi:hypothetical protein